MTSLSKPCFEHMPRWSEIVPLLTSGDALKIADALRILEDRDRDMERFIFEKICNATPSGGGQSAVVETLNGFGIGTGIVASGSSRSFQPPDFDLPTSDTWDIAYTITIIWQAQGSGSVVLDAVPASGNGAINEHIDVVSGADRYTATTGNVVVGVTGPTWTPPAVAIGNSGSVDVFIQRVYQTGIAVAPSVLS